ncbi:uncharacterized protein YgbK (DUF1537 family) [Salirhabdus euzebyi]|uniref:Uncharacterized protein YgbK (DUF1537 family) n=1 Tax=Salirhabdus euzebyi TaxID=394506 RepID=A0A841Q8J6_9BACI|nr:four-carbon acid sugar kinase family protein [Salirhabdus euzebyi]MBB6454597.1 uncharacterized protein YgbK (DUF1537 family) [Salirhabdus euzebyi]
MKVGVIADDLTGANGTGVKLTQQGLKTFTNFNDKEINIPEIDAAVCIDTDSRYTSPECAQERVREAIRKLQKWETDIICKRIDSTFRGNIGPEIDVLLDHITDTVGIIVPSFPATNRIVTGGYMLVNGIPLQESDVANDPVTPLCDSYLPSILNKQTKQKVELIPLNKVSEGSLVIEKEISNHIQNGARLILCDAITEEHIESIAESMTKIKHKQLIPIDPGPLTNYFVEKTSNLQEQDKAKILVSIGSATSVTQGQIQFLVNKLKAKPIFVQPSKLATFSNEWNEEVTRVVREATKIVNKESVIIVTTNHPDFPKIDFKRISKLEGVSDDLLAKRITDGLAEISKQILQYSNGSIKGCFFSGGDVTSSFCKNVKASGINLIDEIMPLVAFAEIADGEFDGLPIVTKGGLIGDSTAIYESIIYLSKKLKRNKVPNV